MGLDMYLYRRRYIKAWDHQKPEERHTVILKKGGKKIPLIHPSYIEEEVGYWRKANQIHGWFVENCAGGEDNCQQIEVSTEQLKELLKLCKDVVDSAKLVPGKLDNGTEYANGVETKLYEDGQVIEDTSLAKELLPVTAGFFFGNYDEETAYDEWYLKDLKDTIAILEPCLMPSNLEDYSVDYYYQASW